MPLEAHEHKNTESVPPNRNWIATAASDCWRDAARTVSDHPVLSAAAALSLGVVAMAALRGRGGRAALETVSESGEALGANVARVVKPLWLASENTSAGIHLLTTDLSGVGFVDAFPKVPKLVIADPIYKAGGLITDFTGDLGHLYEKAASSVVRLNVSRAGANGAQLVKSGSGFFNTEGHIVTAHHVIDGGEQIDVFSSASEKVLKAAVKFADPEHDVAVLKLVNPPADILAKIRPFDYRPLNEKLIASEQVVGFGYPNGVATLHAMPGNFADWKSIQLGTEPSMIGDAMRSFMEAPPGSSGGVMVDAQGRIFGAIVQMHPINRSAWSIPISRFRGF